jgi:hypothetical protein
VPCKSSRRTFPVNHGVVNEPVFSVCRRPAYTTVVVADTRVSDTRNCSSFDPQRQSTFATLGTLVSGNQAETRARRTRMH